MGRSTKGMGGSHLGAAPEPQAGALARGSRAVLKDGALVFLDSTGAEDVSIFRSTAGTLKVTGAIVANTITGSGATGAVTFGGDVTVAGALTSTGKVTASAALDIVGAATFFSYAGFGGNIGLGSGASLIGAFGATAVGKQTVTGSRGGNVALASLLTAMATLGWITDSTTA